MLAFGEFGLTPGAAGTMLRWGPIAGEESVLMQNHAAAALIEADWTDGASRVDRNLSTARLVEEIIARAEGRLTDRGAVVVETGKYTGRSPKDKYIVREPGTDENVDWGEVNQPIAADRFEAIESRVRAHLADTELFVCDAFGGADRTHRLPIRVIAERAYHALFARQLFIRPTADELASHQPEWTIIASPSFETDPARDGTRSEVFVGVHFSRKTILILGTLYAGEIKKSVFTILNYLLPLQGVLSMHCSANVGQRGDVALFFGLSGTGKTTLSADPRRRLVGDDEHGWSDDGVFNFEGGCYAKCINLSAAGEPEIYDALRFGSLLENVILDPATRTPDFSDSSLTENTRAAYPIDFIPRAVLEGTAGHPRQIIFLTCDAFGVLPPVAKLTPDQAMYHFLSGYTAKVAGTERGLGKEPQAVFSTCFGAPFLPLPPSRYADLLGERMRRHRVDAWLVNTGWSGGGFGVGQRMSLRHTRSIVEAITEGGLRDVPYQPDPRFGIAIPAACPGVPSKILQPRETWVDPAAYDREASMLADRFRKNFERFGGVSTTIRDAGPRVG
jgi:phosphoenolpyruvate carboxykinase (ATP)